MSCFINPQIQVGQVYTIESDDGARTGQVLITSIDSNDCIICYDMISGDWIDLGLDYELEENVKIYYTSNSYCLLDPNS
jgi:hypothetical protein